MVEVKIEYTGNLKTKCTHGPSGSVIKTDAPVDNQGEGSLFSPTDLVATSMGSCMLTIMGIAAKEKNIALEGATVTAIKEMIADPHRRIAKISLTFNMPSGIAPQERKMFEAAAHTCPVKQSLHPKTEVEINFIYPDA